MFSSTKKTKTRILLPSIHCKIKIKIKIAIVQ